MTENPQPDYSRKPLKFSPLSRLYFELEQQFRNSKDAFNEAKFSRLVEKQNEAAHLRNNLFRYAAIFDAVVLLLLFGKSIMVPGFGLSVADIPAARELATVIAGLQFQFGCYAFLNWLGYLAIIETINRLKNDSVDHDYLTAPEKTLEFMEKLFREKMNTYAPDHVIAGKGFVAMGRVVLWLGLASILSMLIAHLFIAGFSVLTTFRETDSIVFAWLFLLLVVTSNLAGLLTMLTQHIPFNFYFPKV